jgi:hypothetical protein
MKKFAVIENGAATNVIVAEDLQAVSVFYGDKQLIEVTPETGDPAIGREFDQEAGKFIPGCYQKGWEFDKDSWTWKAPTPYPQDGKVYEWDNESETWIEFDLPLTGEELPNA